MIDTVIPKIRDTTPPTSNVQWNHRVRDTGGATISDRFHGRQFGDPAAGFS